MFHYFIITLSYLIISMFHNLVYVNEINPALLTHDIWQMIYTYFFAHFCPFLSILISVLLSALVKRFIVSSKRDLKKNKVTSFNWICVYYVLNTV